MRYRLIERLGVGGMSEVWRGFDDVLDREVAIKFVVEKAEALVEARISHPNIVHVHDYGQWTDGRPYVVMELLEGKTLSTVLNGGFSLPWRQVVRICAEIASALSAAHARGVVHRDVTTSNVMLTPTGARLLDFGIAAFAGQAEPARDSGDLQGTPAFMAPERLRRGEVTPAADVYALGVLCYRALTGRLPWPAHTQNELLDAHLWHQPAPLPRIPGLPDEVAQMCLRCLAKAPEERPTAVEIVAMLGPIVHLPALAPTFMPARRRAETVTVPVLAATAPIDAQSPRHRFAVVLGGMAAAVLGIFAWGIPDAPKPAAWNPPASPPTTCRVTYQQQPSTTKSFAATVTVHNDGVTPVSPWQVQFAWPGDQTLLVAQGVQAHQQGRDVLLHGDRLDPGAEVKVGLTGSYGQLNALPSHFSLAGVDCATTILASPPPQPVIQVVRETDGDHEGGKHKKKG